MPKYDLPIGSLLEQDGLSVTGVDDNNQPIISDRDGKTYALPVDELLKRDGINKNDVNVVYNTPDKPIEVSPVDVSDRARMSFGNIKGNLNFLKNKFDDVQYNPDSGFVVQKAGVWHRVDPTLLGKGDAWQKAKELVSDFADLQDVGINATLTGGGALLGLGIGPGGVIGGAAAGGALSGNIRTSLGRILGTYDATPDEQLQDVGLEAIYSAGGEVINAGVKPGLDTLVSSAKNIARWGTDTTKELFATVAGNLAKIDRPAMQTMFEEAPRVANTMRGAISKLGEKAEDRAVYEYLGNKKLEVMTSMLDEGESALPKKFGEMVESLATDPKAKNLRANVGGFVNKVMDTAEEIGLGHFTPAEGGGKQFNFFSPRQVGIRDAQGLSAELTTGNEESRDALKTLLGYMDGLRGTGVLSGKNAAKTLTKIESNLNSAMRAVYKTDDKASQRLVSKLTEAWRGELKSTFAAVGLEEQYGQQAKLYADYGASVRLARKLLKSDTGTGIEQLTNQFTGTAGKNLKAKGMVGNIVNLLGERGQELYRDFMVTHSAQQFSRKAPQIGIVKGFGVASSSAYALGAGVAPAIVLPAAGALVAQSSPRVVSSEIQAAQKYLPYANKGLDFLKTLPPDKLKALFQNEDAMKTFVRVLSAGPATEDHTYKTLIQKSGVADGNTPATLAPQTSADDQGHVPMVSPEGHQGLIPRGNVDKALKRGFKHAR